MLSLDVAFSVSFFFWLSLTACRILIPCRRSTILNHWPPRKTPKDVSFTWENIFHSWQNQCINLLLHAKRYEENRTTCSFVFMYKKHMVMLFLKLLIDNVKNLYLTSKINFTQKNSLWQLRFQKQMKGNDLMSHLQNVALQVITLKN